MKTYIVVYLGSLAITLMLMPFVMFFAQTLNIYDDLNARKIHARAIPRIGGVVIVLAMLGMTIPVLLLDNYIGMMFRSVQFRFCVLVAASIFIFMMGFVDDICKLRVPTKILGQLCAATLVCWSGIRIEHVVLGDWLVVNLGWLSWPLTILWIVGITNAINLIDGLDGLAAGISAITCGVIAIFAIYSAQPVMAVLMLALLGSLSGFLFFNFNPAKIFMGDGGSFFLGFILAGASVLCATKSATLIGIGLPVLALGIPIVDTLFSIFRRFIGRQSIFQADRGHIHHRLLDMGFSQRRVVLMLYGLTMSATVGGVLMMITHDIGYVVVFGLVVFMVWLGIRMVGQQRIRQALQAKKLDVDSEPDVQEDIHSDSCAKLKSATSIFEWWEGIQQIAAELDCAWVRMPLANRDGSERLLSWEDRDPAWNPEHLMEMHVPVRQRRSDDNIRMAVGFKLGRNLESNGERAALFSRMVEGYNLETLSAYTDTLQTPVREAAESSSPKVITQDITPKDIPGTDVVISSEP